MEKEKRRAGGKRVIIKKSKLYGGQRKGARRFLLV